MNTKLNSAQQEAINHKNGPLLVLAGAGTGKTKVLTARIANLISNKDALPSQILAVTFTNKAANEMKERIIEILGYEIPEMYIGTFHSISAKILRKHAEYVNLHNNFNIIDQDDQLRLIKRISSELNIDNKELSPKKILNKISLWKDKLIKPFHNNEQLNDISKIYEEYCDELQRSNACDFGDLILHVITILNEQPQIQNYYNNRFKYILVDEYQDTNSSQYLWLRLLAQGHNNICCVGDDDQSIYSFRGAEIENILRFEKDFENAKIIKLEQNYRSTKHILNAAAQLINSNEKRHNKTLYTNHIDGEKISILANWDDNAEARNIIEKIETFIIRKKNLKNIAILVRAFFQTRAIEEALIANAIPYRIVGGLKFYDRKEIKDIIAYLRIVNSTSDNLALERIINTPKRGVGKASFAKFNHYAKENNISIYESIEYFSNNKLITGKSALTIKKFINLINETQKNLEHNSLKDIAKKLAEDSGYIEEIKSDIEVNSATRLENLKEFFYALEEFNDLNEFLEHVALVNEVNEENNHDNINILTLHSAKGLEFDIVFLTGWEEGIFPHQRSLDESGNKGLEEERRLAYVGITRAKEKLYISYAQNRRVFNKWQSSIPSRFLSELPPKSLEGYKMTNNIKIRQNNNIKHIEKFQKNERVKHPTYGDGYVKSIIGDVLEVNFDSGKARFVTAKTVKSN
jgi:DNA helicase-2/ATP-dependent DNA helicase PcrA